MTPTNPISVIQNLLQSQQGGQNPAQKTGDFSFSDMLKSGVENVRNAQMEGEKMSAKALTGEADMTQVVQSVAKAEVMLQTMVTIRDRLLSAYQELMSVRI